MKVTMVCTLVVACLASVTETAHAGAWLQKPGKYYVKLSLNHFSTTEQFSLAGQRQPLNAQLENLRDSKFTDTNLSVYGEVGVLDWFTAVFSTSYKRYASSGFNLSDQSRFHNTVSGPSDLFVGGRIRLVAMPFALALQPMIKLPTGDMDRSIPLGTGETDLELRVQLGTKLPLPLNNYFTADVGYSGRGGTGFHDEVPYFVEFGVSPAKRLLLKAAVDGRKSTQTLSSQAEVVGAPNQNMLIVDQDFTRLWGGLIYSATPTVDLSLEFSSVLSGTNTLAGRTFYLGLAFKTP
ncbi:hypothetical protein MJD09_14980 [bacterium]|nr:hypothetical protein [bacterium]